MSEFLEGKKLSREGRITLLKKLLKDMDKGLITPEEIKKRFKKILSEVHPVEIAIIENALVKEGIPIEKILSDFKTGKRNYADFWLEIKGRFIYIKYYAARDIEGKYLGTLEVTQDVTAIKALRGERRIYSEE